MQKTQLLLANLQSWYAAQCDDDWEHQFGISIGTLDNPGWSLSIDLTGTLLENKHFPALARKNSDEEWTVCYVNDKKFIGYAGTHQLDELIGVFLTWAKTEPHWLDVKYENPAEEKARRDLELWNMIGKEYGSYSCRAPECYQRAVAHSAFCRDHHFEMIRGYRFSKLRRMG